MISSKQLGCSFGLRVHSLTLDALLSRALPGTAVATPARFGWVLAMEEHLVVRARGHAAAVPMGTRWTTTHPACRTSRSLRPRDPMRFFAPQEAGSWRKRRRLWDCGPPCGPGTPDPAESACHRTSTGRCSRLLHAIAIGGGVASSLSRH